MQVCIFISFILLHFYIQEGNQISSVGHFQHGRRTELFIARCHIKLRFQQRSPGFHLLSQSSSFGQRNRGGGDEDHLQVPAKGRAPDIKDRTRPLIPKGFTGQDLLVESVVREPIMEDLVDEKKDGSQKSTESNPTTRKKIARMTAGEAHGLEYLCQRPCGPPSRAKTTFKERTQRREPPIHHFQEPYRKGWTISNVHTLGMAQSNYGPLIPSTGLGGHANEHTPSLGQSVTHRFGPPPKSSAITNEGPQHIDGSTSGCLESATGYQSFFKKRTLESNQPATPPLADPMSARHIAHEYAQRRCWQDSIPLEPPMGYREVLEQRGENEHQPPYSPPGPPSRIFKVPKVPPRVNLPATNPIERPMEYRPADPHPGPPSRMFKIPKVTQRVNSSANNPVERPMEYQAAKPSLGHPTTPKNIVNDDLQRLAAAANLAIKSPTSQHRVANERLQGMDHIANSSSSRTVAAGTIPPPLPPSVEEAYKKKCIELKRRMQEVEESNDVFRVRKARLARGIRKMRLERAYLLEMLGKRMKKNGSSVDGFPQPYDEESDGSSEGPPTVSFSSPSTCRLAPLKSLANYAYRSAT